MKKLGRNDPCWCGLGKKYKHCHLDRETQTPIPRSEFFERTKKAFLSKKYCLVPPARLNECDDKIVQAHTVPRMSLKQIARAGHVYSFVSKIGALTLGGVPMPWGINQASTFKGFCAQHDNMIFSPLEKQPFCGTPEQCFLLGYRALASELYTKRAAGSLSDLYREGDRGEPCERQVAWQEVVDRYETGANAMCQYLDDHKSTYDDILESRQFSTVRAYIIEFETAPLVMCSGAFFPVEDFRGAILQDPAALRSPPDLLTVTSFYIGNRGVVALSWLAKSDRACCAFIESLKAIPDELVTAALVRLIFTHLENIQVSLDWWDGLPQGTKNTLSKRLAEVTSLHTLLDDGVVYNPWNVAVARRYQI